MQEKYGSKELSRSFVVWLLSVPNYLSVHQSVKRFTFATSVEQLGQFKPNFAHTNLG